MTDSKLEVTAERDGKSKHKITVKLDGVPMFVDTVNVSTAAARERFIGAVTGKFSGLDRDLLDEELLKLAASDGVAPSGEDAVEPDRLAGMSKETIDEANTLLDDPELITRICDDAEAVGVAGERELVATIYLIGVSRLLPRPLAGIIRGSSSSGKSYTVEKVAHLFPPECLVHATQMTPQALFHMKPGSLVHRWVVAGERSRLEDDDRAEATRALREMLASGKLSKLMPVKTGNGIETQLIEQSGPISFTETTTLTTVFEEDSNRALMLQTDESAAQTKRIITALARRHTREREDTGRIVSVHHALQRLLPRSDVRVPFSDRLAADFLCERVEVRRAFPQLISLMQASALIHHKQRGKGDDDAILADARDYHLARRLIIKPFSQSLGGGLSQSARDFLAILPSSDVFTSSGIAKTLKKSKSSTSGWISELHDAGALEVIEEGRGRKATKWKLTGKTPDAGDEAIPTMESMFPEVAGRMDATRIR